MKTVMVGACSDTYRKPITGTRIRRSHDCLSYLMSRRTLQKLSGETLGSTLKWSISRRTIGGHYSLALL